MPTTGSLEPSTRLHIPVVARCISRMISSHCYRRLYRMGSTVTGHHPNIFSELDKNLILMPSKMSLGQQSQVCQHQCLQRVPHHPRLQPPWPHHCHHQAQLPRHQPRPRQHFTEDPAALVLALAQWLEVKLSGTKSVLELSGNMVHDHAFSRTELRLSGSKTCLSLCVFAHCLMQCLVCLFHACIVIASVVGCCVCMIIASCVFQYNPNTHGLLQCFL